MTVTVPAYAKINLYLDVVGKRSNGYHDVVTVMQSVTLHDTLTVTRQNTKNIHLTIDNSTLPADESNLVIRAANAYFEASRHAFGVEAMLEKRIPMQAGMGGGSADAAAMLHALNRLDGYRFSPEELSHIGSTIGADVPFCVRGGTCLCRGIGELITPLESTLSLPLVVAIGHEGVSTPAAFAQLDRRYLNFEDFHSDQTPQNLLDALQNGDVSHAVSALFNRFEEVIEPMRPAVCAIKETLLQNGALAAQMSGSGPAVFGVFKSESVAQRAVKALQDKGIYACVCNMLN